MKKFASLILISICFLYSVCFAGQETEKNILNVLTNVSGDGSLEVFETWNVGASNGDFLERKLFVDRTKNQKIEDVKVIAKYQNASGDRQFEMYSGDLKFGEYNVLDSGDYYFIRCGVDKFNNNLIYNVSYTIKNGIDAHSDCAEMEWYLFKDYSFENTELVSGEICFPTLRSSGEEVSAWLKTDNSNIQLDEISNGKIKFSLNNFARKSYLEIKALFPNDIFQGLENVSGDYAKEDIIQNENGRIAEENAKKEFKNNMINAFEGILLLILFIVLFSLIKVAGMTRKIHPTEKMEYSKELPCDGITPGQALFLKTRGTIYMGKLFSAVLMSLKLKEVIEIVDINSGGYIKILNQEPELYLDEKLVFDFLLECVNKFGKEKMQISIKMLKMYISHNTSRVSKLKHDIERELKSSIKSFDESESKKVFRYLRYVIYYLIIIIIMSIVHKGETNIFTIHTWVSVISAVSIIFCAKIAYRANVFSEKGENEREKIRAFQRYLLNFKEYGAPVVAIWEYYLIFATAFGITEIVLQEIRKNYINMGNEPCWETFKVYEKIMESNFSKCFVMAISSK